MEFKNSLFVWIHHHVTNNNNLIFSHHLHVENYHLDNYENLLINGQSWSWQGKTAVIVSLILLFLHAFQSLYLSEKNSVCIHLSPIPSAFTPVKAQKKPEVGAHHKYRMCYFYTVPLFHV